MHRIVSLFALGLLVTASVVAQNTSTPDQTTPQAAQQQQAQPPAGPAKPRNTICSLATLRRSLPELKLESTPENMQKMLDEDTRCLLDWPYLSRYADGNERLLAAGPVKDRVVFMGDSITDFWDLTKYFPSKPYVDRGISGETTAQMLVRFRPDVIDLGPKVVVILAGTNDIAGNTGPATLEQIEGNIASMFELARAHDIRVVLSSVTPTSDYGKHPQTAQRPPEKIRTLNRWLIDFCRTNGCTYLDYATPMTDEHGFLKRELSEDGLHPNAKGYEMMAPLAKKAIEEAMQGSSISITINPLAEKVPLASEVKIQTTLTNISDKSVYAWRDNAREKGELCYSVDLRDAAGNSVSATKYYRALNGDPSPDLVIVDSGAPIPLERGESIINFIRLNDLFDIPHPGRYSVSVQRKCLPDTQHPSNVIWITITPH